jgi:IS30 family transposase
MNKEKIHTITLDNGKEFSDHKTFVKKLKSNVYFARPYKSNERGSNENFNGLLRQYFPKHKSLDKVTDKKVKAAERELNDRPRKTLGFLSPQEVHLKRARRK